MRITGKATPQILESLSTGVPVGVQRTQLRYWRVLQEICLATAAAAPALRSLANHPRAKATCASLCA